MKKAIILFTISLIISSLINSQTLGGMGKYILNQRGDTLIIKDCYLSGEPNTLSKVIEMDTANVPFGRVYMLINNGFYPEEKQIILKPGREIKIIGEDKRILVNRTDAIAPPLICGYSIGENPPETFGIVYNNNLTVKNVNIVVAANEGTIGSVYFDAGKPGVKLTLDNVLMESTRSTFIRTRPENTCVKLSNCYFVNMSGDSTIGDGGVYEAFSDQDSLTVENCTHIMAQGSVYKFKEFVWNRININHNDFINCVGPVFLDKGYQSKMNITNNIFINCNVQPITGVKALDGEEADEDQLPIGIVNVRDLPGTYNQLTRRIYVDRNVPYWSPELADLVSTLNSMKVSGVSEWKDQMSRMNARAQAMFDNNTKYPYLIEGAWTKQLQPPAFDKAKDLLTTQLALIKNFIISKLSKKIHSSLSMWRLINYDKTWTTFSEWPIPVNLSFSDSQLLKFAFSGYPVGDLNWFPKQKNNWTVQRNAELKIIETILATDAGLCKCTDPLPDGIEESNRLPNKYEVAQNYPNPFNPTTTIKFSLPKESFVTLKVYDMLGREVSALVNENKPAGFYDVTFNAISLPSGVYVYKVQAGNFIQMKKMLLVK